ncbi:TrbI/VirB10 family protein [Acidovorax sp. D2M1]|uniref:TrbI/VirB10 family protein n=1 Tax=Acidovorax benzenivorans TaxID=2987520 RepID=A0ABT5RZX2_9BURK|nr:TrbI/VirB10 family protein [Acidovorax benzenivorans]MDD2179253.1 TrbI/VirB10 family protein [Acidovorax benzenivorans]
MGTTDTPEAPQTSAPKADPEAMALRASPRPVTRLNRRTLVVLVGGLSAAVLGATLWSLSPNRRDRGAGTVLFNVDRIARTEDLERLPKDYAGLGKLAPPVLGPPLPGDLGPAIVKSQQPMEMRAPGVDPDQAEEAAKSSVFFRSSGHGGGAKPVMAEAVADSQAVGSGNQGFDPLAGASPQAAPADPTAVQNRQDAKEAFLAKAGEGGTRNPGSLQMPVSPYQVMAGTVIPAALVTGINSDLPGQVIANVTEAVYDTATGKHLLIPQGSRLMGRYDSQVAFGQRRVLLVWTRLILPDTSSVALDRLPGIDPAGYAGLEDGVDWHWDRILAGAALSTLLGVGAELAAPDSRTDGNRIVIAAREGAQDAVNQVGQEITKRNMSIQPTLTIRPGFPVRVMVSKDLVLRPYQPLFYDGSRRGAR